MGLCAVLRNDMEHFLDERGMSWLWRQVAQHPMPCLREMVAT